MKKTWISALVGASVLLSSGLASAQAKPEDVITYRKGAYQVIGWHMRPMAGMVRGDIAFDAALFSRSADVVAMMSTLVPGAFLPGSDKGTTRAKPEIWSDAAGFQRAMESFQSEASKLAAAAKGASSVDAVRGQFGAMVKSCSNCHDNYRSK